MTQPTDRPGINDLTSDQLDALYGERDLSRHLLAKVRETSAQLINREQLRADQAEATLAAVRAELTAIDRDVRGKSPVALAGIRHTSSRIRAVLDQHGQTPA